MRRTNRSIQVEPLEERKLLAGVTLLIHGHEGSINGWVSAAATAIANRVGSSQVSQYVMKIARSKGKLAVTSFDQTGGPRINRSTLGEAIVKVDWTAVDDGSESTEDVGKVVGDYLLTTHGTLAPLAQLPVHLIGHSRGASMAVSISKELGRAGVWVDQETFLDPHPVEGLFGYGDTTMRVYSNVVFADNYWRDDGNEFNLDPDGRHVSGAHEGNLNQTVQKKFVVSAHMAVPAYYDGTIDLHAISDKDHPIFSDWYGNTAAKPARNATGYVFSRLGGGARPADGLTTAFGGTAPRVAIGATGTQWANGGAVSVTGGSTFAVGEKLKLRFIYQDRDGPSTATVVLDRDQNPFNGNNVRTMRRAELPAAANMTVTTLSAFSEGVSPGKYYVYTVFSDAAGHTRYAYAKPITLTSAASSAPLPAAANSTVVVAKKTPSSVADAILKTA